MGWTLHYGPVLKDGQPSITGWPSRVSEEARLRGLEKYGRGPWELPRYSEPDADYAVLQAVREAWSAELCGKFRHHIECLWCRDEEELAVGRWKMGPMTYRPGDYAKAALLALAEE